MALSLLGTPGVSGRRAPEGTGRCDRLSCFVTSAGARSALSLVLWLQRVNAIGQVSSPVVSTNDNANIQLIPLT